MPNVVSRDEWRIERQKLPLHEKELTKHGDQVNADYNRGIERLTDAYPLLDVTPYGRQEGWEDSPPGWPRKPTYG